ncbi:MAG: class B sortase [Dorea sp.]|jgi:sortase B|nr:class B sortase [Dorea sp.]
MIQEEFEQDQPKKSKKGLGKSRIIIIVLVLVVLAGAGAGAGFYLYNSEQKAKAAAEQAKKADPDKAAKRYDDLKIEVTVDADDPIYRKIDFAAAQAVNPDVYAWIWIPGTNVDYPILQSDSDDISYYLDHTIEGLEGLPGSIYTEKYNAKDFTDPVNVIYGHNMKNGSMFADLHKFEDQAFFDGNPYIYIYLPDKTLKYRIFAAITFDDRYLMENYNFSDPADFQTYLDELRSSINGHVNNEVNVTQETGIITLSTCISNAPNNRWMVNATRED